MSDGPCQCWTNPSYIHEGHCCMRPNQPDCHLQEGLAKYREQQNTRA